VISIRRPGLFASLALTVLLFSGSALAEKTLLKDGDWEVYTDGRAGAFISYTHGQGFPQPTYDAAGNQIHDVSGGGLNVQADRDQIGLQGQKTQGVVDRWRVHTGFIGNLLGLGARAKVDEHTQATAYIQLWSYIESEQQRKGSINQTDVRQGYLKLEGTWGSLLGGRSRTLFSRGATDIDVAYAHRYGVGFSGNSVDSSGPSQGQIGFGVLGSGFAAGFVYATPRLAGLQLSVGVFDPIALQGAWDRTKMPRPEAELTFEHEFGTFGKVILFGNGAYQKLYKKDSSDSTQAAGFGYGGRVEVGPVHLGVAGHYGTGLGLNYALEPSDATLDPNGVLRKFDGYYVQSQVVAGQFDFSAGWGITRVFLLPQDSVADANGNIPHSVVKSQTGINAGVLYHWKPWLHLDVDYFRADFRWFLGEKQVLNSVNAGFTMTW
jgi:Gram-negative porin